MPEEKTSVICCPKATDDTILHPAAWPASRRGRQTHWSKSQLPNVAVDGGEDDGGEEVDRKLVIACGSAPKGQLRALGRPWTLLAKALTDEPGPQAALAATHV